MLLLILNHSELYQWTVPNFVIKMYKSLPTIVRLPFSIHSWVNCSHVCSQTKKTHVLLCKVGQRLLCALQCDWLLQLL